VGAVNTSGYSQNSELRERRFESKHACGRELSAPGTRGYSSQIVKRVCYIHAGPHKTGTTSIQWFLQESRAELLKHGVFVPESETKHGAHRAIVEKLCGQELGEHREPLATKSIQAIVETPCEAIIISSEALEGTLRSGEHAKMFFNRVRELNLEPKLILFARNQSQWINSIYSSAVKTFRRSDPFQDFAAAAAVARYRSLKFSTWIELADVHDIELIARPFTKETIARGVVPEFLLAIGINLSQFRDTEPRRNERAGPFTVSVAREVMRSLGIANNRLKWLQAMRCKAKLAAYLGEKKLADTGYCGLTTTMARRIEEELRLDNDAFAKRAWGRTWAEIFTADIREEFKPNDFEICRPSWALRLRLRRAVREMKAMVQDILLDPSLAIEAPWNDLRKRSGLDFTR
jgi:hypothetical protein